MKRILVTGYPWPLLEVADAFLLRPAWKTRVLPIRPTRHRLIWPLAVAGAMPGIDLWYQLSGYAIRGLNFFLSGLSSRLGVPTIIHWTGTDVPVAGRLIRRHPRLLGLLGTAHHWACAPWLVREVMELGFQCEFMPLPKTRLARALDREPPPLPKQFRILSYLNDRTHQKYGSRHLIRLARDFPHVTVAVAGAEGTFLRECPPNLQFLGWVEDMSTEYARATVLVRMVEHDGYGGTVQEALACGRQAIWTYPMPGVHRVNGYDDLKRCVGKLLLRHQQGTLPLNGEGREFLKRTMHRTVLDRKIVEAVERILETS